MEQYTSTYSLYLIFFKVNSDNKVLKDQKYEFVSIDTEQKTGLYSQVGEYGQYYFKEGAYYAPESVENFSINILPEFVKEELSKVNTLEDALAFEKYGNENVRVSSYNWNKNVQLSFYIPVKLKQVGNSAGYIKQDLIISGRVEVDFYYDENNIITI